MVEFFKSATPQKKAEQEINFDTLSAYLRARFPERRHMDKDPDYISKLVSGLLQAGYKTIGHVEQMLDNAWEAFLHYEEEHPPAEGKLADAVVASIVARMSNEEYLRIWAGQVYIHPVRATRAVAEEKELYDDYRKYIKNRGV
jgi:hypothetical protein